MHWATLRRHSDLFWVATSASCQVIPILNKSLLVVLLQFVHGRPGPLLNPGTSQCNACRGMHWWSIRITCPSQRSLLSLSMSSMLCCVVLKIQETNWTFWPYLHYGKLIYRFLQLVFKTKTKPWHHKLSTMTSLLITKPNWHKPAPDSPLTTQHWLTALRSMFWNAASEMA